MTAQQPRSLNELREQLIDVTIRMFFGLSCFLLPTSLARYFDMGWQPVYLLHCALWLVLLFLFLKRHTLSYNLRAGSVVSIIGLLAIGSTLSYGMAGPGFALFMALVISSLLFLNLTTALACVALFFTFGVASTYGHLSETFNSASNIQKIINSWPHWLASLLLMNCVALLLVIGFRKVMAHLETTMEQAQNDFDTLLQDLPGAVFVLDWSQIKPELETLISAGPDELDVQLRREPALFNRLLALQKVSYGNRTGLALVDCDHNDLSDVLQFYRTQPLESHPLFYASDLLRQQRCTFRSVVNSPKNPARTIEWTYHIPGASQDDWSKVIAVGVDVTARSEQERIAEQQHAEVSRQFASLSSMIESSNAPIVSVDLDGRIMQWNSAMSSLTGFAAHNVIGQHFAMITTQLTRKSRAFETAMKHVFTGQSLDDFEVHIQDSDAKPHILSAQFSPIRDKYDFVCGAVAVFNDVTDERAAQQQQKRLTAAMNQLDQGVALLDKQSRIIWHNSAWSEINENAREFIEPGMQFEDLLRHLIEQGDIPEAKADIDGWISRRMALHGTMDEPFEVVRNHKRLLVREQRLADGSLIITVMNVTEVTSLRAKVVQSEKLASLGEMATGIAHELNQPLSVIRMSAENCLRKAKKGTLDNATLEEKLTKVTSYVDRASTITNHMRAFGRDSALNLAPIDVLEAVNNTLNMCDHQLRLAAVEVDLQIPAILPRVTGDLVRLEQVLINLVTNARQSMTNTEGSARRLTLRTESSEHTLKLYVEDSGPGIPEKLLDTIFDPFFTTKEVGEGTGLGLSISYGLIREMGGELTAGNTSQGARFEITLPLAEATTVVPA